MKNTPLFQEYMFDRLVAILREGSYLFILLLASYCFTEY